MIIEDSFCAPSLKWELPLVTLVMSHPYINRSCLPSDGWDKWLLWAGFISKAPGLPNKWSKRTVGPLVHKQCTKKANKRPWILLLPLPTVQLQKIAIKTFSYMQIRSLSAHTSTQTPLLMVGATYSPISGSEHLDWPMRDPVGDFRYDICRFDGNQAK